MTDFELEMQYFDLVQKLIEEKKLLEETIKINADETARLKEQIKELVINFDMCRYDKGTFINKVMSVINGR